MTALPTPQGPIAAAITATLKQSLQPTHLEGSSLPTPHPHPTPLVSCTPSDAPPLPLPQWSTRATCTAFLRLQKRTSGAAARHKLRASNLHHASHFPSPMLHRVVVGQCEAHVQSPLGLRDPHPPPPVQCQKASRTPLCSRVIARSTTPWLPSWAMEEYAASHAPYALCPDLLSAGARTGNLGIHAATMDGSRGRHHQQSRVYGRHESRAARGYRRPPEWRRQRSGAVIMTTTAESLFQQPQVRRWRPRSSWTII